MPTAKHFQCPFCSFNVTASDEDEVMKHVAMHKADRHPDADISEDQIRKRIVDTHVEAPLSRA